MKATKVLVLFSLAASGPSQVQWKQLPLIPARGGHALAYDEARGRTVLFGGVGLSDTWEWDGSDWIQRFPAHNPPARTRHALAYDSARKRVLLFGGGFSDTWEWDGNDWAQRSPAVSPAPRSHHVMAWDSLRGRALLFGGGGPGSPETWQWDGSSWLQVFPSISPAGLESMAYDAARDRVVGIGDTTPDTWEWDGSAWTQRSPAQRPSVTGSVFYDTVRQRIVLASGSALTWEWDGANWVDVSSAGNPPARTWHATAYDSARKRAVMFGGYGGPLGARADTWEWDGRAWLVRAARPTGRGGFALAYDSVRDRVVMFGGVAMSGPFYFGETWEWDGENWEDHTPASGPIYRTDHSMAYDPVRQRVVLFGGKESTGEWTYYDDTWEWDGIRWSRRSVSGPDRRAGGAMAFDSRRGRMVLFGGDIPFTSCSTPTNTVTWEWDGNSWYARPSTTRPPACASYLMAYDSAREKTVLVTSAGSAGTWEWDGQDWVQLSPTKRPQSPAWMTYDSARGRTVLGAGYPNREVWEWDGADWTQRSPGGSVPARGGVAAYDSKRSRILYVDQFLSPWEYVPTNPASWAAFGSGCAGSAGTPSLLALENGGPWTGERFALELGNLPPGNSALVWLGTSRTSWGNLSLPLSLAVIGMPGCDLRVSPVTALPVFNRTGNAVLGLDIPLDAAVVGAAFYSQAFVADRAANPFGATVSNGGAGRIGAK